MSIFSILNHPGSFVKYYFQMFFTLKVIFSMAKIMLYDARYQTSRHVIQHATCKDKISSRDRASPQKCLKTFTSHKEKCRKVLKSVAKTCSPLVNFHFLSWNLSQFPSTVDKLPLGLRGWGEIMLASNKYFKPPYREQHAVFVLEIS